MKEFLMLHKALLSILIIWYGTFKVQFIIFTAFSNINYSVKNTLVLPITHIVPSFLNLGASWNLVRLHTQMCLNYLWQYTTAATAKAFSVNIGVSSFQKVNYDHIHQLPLPKQIFHIPRIQQQVVGYSVYT